jgi:hypothetical protein
MSAVSITSLPEDKVTLGMVSRGDMPFVDIAVTRIGETDDDFDIEVVVGGGLTAVSAESRDVVATLLEIVAGSLRDCDVQSVEGPFEPNPEVTE